MLGLGMHTLIMTVGNAWLLMLISYVRNNQYCTLLDYLANLVFCVELVTNCSGFLLWVLRSILGRLPHWACVFFSISDSVCFFTLTFLIDQVMLLKFLYVTRWKNVGQLNDDLFHSVSQAVTGTFAALYTGYLLLTDAFNAN